MRVSEAFDASAFQSRKEHGRGMDVAGDRERDGRIVAQEAFPVLEAAIFARLACDETSLLRNDRAIDRFHQTITFPVAQVEGGPQSLKNRPKRGGFQSVV